MVSYLTFVVIFQVKCLENGEISVSQIIFCCPKRYMILKKISFKMKILTFMYLTSVNREMEQFSKYVEIKKKGGGDSVRHEKNILSPPPHLKLHCYELKQSRVLTAKGQNSSLF